MYLEQINKIEELKKSESRENILIDLVKSQIIILKKHSRTNRPLYRSLISSLRGAKSTKHIAYLHSERIIQNSIIH